MRKFFTLLLVCFFALSLTCQAAPGQSSAAESGASSASYAWNNPDTGYAVILEDEADLLNEEEESLLAVKMQGVTAYGNAAFRSISVNNSSTASYARNYYYELFGQNSGTLFLIDMDNRELYIFSNGAVNKIITSAYANTITDNVYRYASGGDYYRCASEAFTQINALLSGHRIAQPMKYICNALLSLILAALINYFIVRLCSASSRPSRNEILQSITTKFTFSNPRKKLLSQKKTYSPVRSGGGGGSHHGGGGGHSGGGHSGGGSHGGSGGGHRF